MLLASLSVVGSGRNTFVKIKDSDVNERILSLQLEDEVLVANMMFIEVSEIIVTSGSWQGPHASE